MSLMGKASLERFVRHEYSELTPDLQDAAAQRFIGSHVFVWTALTCDQLRRLYAICRTLHTVQECQS